MPARLARLKPGKRFADRDAYEGELDKLQKKMLALQQTYFHEKRRALIVFEGWDAAGKGGAIRRMVQTLDPRGVHVWPIAAPRADEQARHYLYRFWRRLPLPGTFAVFDRSWYGRVLVERVDQLCAPADWKRAYREIVEFERQLTDDGVRIAKVFLHISPQVQLKRFADRLEDPTKRWKLTQADLDAYLKRDAYQEAAEDMFAKTDHASARWRLVQADSKWRARTDAIAYVIDVLGKGIDTSPPPIDKKLVKAAKALLKQGAR
jgi:AMP-polyphosphate phosphotransferase